MITTPDFIVEITPKQFFCGFATPDRTKPKTTPYPSAAVHLEYRRADELVGVLMSSGFHQAVVANLMGSRVTSDMLQELPAKPAPDPWTLLYEIGAFSADLVAAKHGWTRQELIKQLSSANEKLQELTASLSAANVDRAGLHDSV